MGSFKLHVKTTLLVSAAVLAVFSIVAFFYSKTVKDLERDQMLEASRQQVVARANDLSERLSDRPTPTSVQQAQELADRIRNAGKYRLALVQLCYFPSTREQFDPVMVSAPSEQRRPLMRGEIMQLRQGEYVFGEEGMDDRKTVWAAAPFKTRDNIIAAVYVSIEVPKGTLVYRLNQLTIASMALVVVIVALATYLLFRRLVYKPIDALLVGMARVEGGDLTVKVPPRADDEIGTVTEQFNRMVGRLREFADERAAHARQLEQRVHEATGKLGERNTQLRDANVQLFEIQRQLGQLERLATAGQLAAQFAHEVGTPLNLISGHVQLLQARATDEKTIKRLDIIATQITRIERIVRNMLDQTRRPSARLDPVDLGALLARIGDTIAPTLAARDVVLEAEIDPDLPPVEADADQLQQVFINLVNNSLDAMPEGGRLRVVGSVDGENVRLEMTDTGVGIEEANLPHVFDPLFTTKDKGRGTGFGLAVSQGIVREHGGRIDVASRVGEGTTFTITFPASTRAAAAADGDVAQPADDAPEPKPRPESADSPEEETAQARAPVEG